MATVNLTVKQEALKLREPAQRAAPRLAPNEELFLDPRAITCAVCEAATVAAREYDLCDACDEDLDESAALVSARYSKAVFAFQVAWVELEQGVEMSSERAWWEQVQAYRYGPAFDPATFAAAWERAKSAGGERARLCALWDALDSVAAELEALNPWWRRALAELKTARTVKGWPVSV